MWVWMPEGPDAIVSGFRRATVDQIDDSGSQQIMRRVRGLASERFEDVYRPQPHGFSSHPPAGSEGLFLALGGRSDRVLGLGFEHQDHRPKSLPEGAAALYDADGKIIKLVKSESVWDAGGKPLTIRNATTIRVEGQTDVTVGLDGRWVRVRPHRVDLGIPTPTQEAPFRVVTEGGPSNRVFAWVDD